MRLGWDGAVAVFILLGTLSVPCLATDGGPDKDKKTEAAKKSAKAKKKKKAGNGGMRVNAGPRKVGRRGVSPMGRQLGVGLEFGYPTSVTAKLMLGRDQAVVGGIGFGVPGVFSPSLTVHADYLWHPHVLASAPPFVASWYVGGGAFVGVTNGRAKPVFNYVYSGVPNFMIFGLRLPLGLQVAMNKLPIEAYLELVPTVAIFPYLGWGPSFAVGARYYF